MDKTNEALLRELIYHLIAEEYRVNKQDCTRWDGKKGSYVLKYKPKKKTSKKKDSQGFVKAGCHTSKEKAHGQRAAIEGG